MAYGQRTAPATIVSGSGRRMVSRGLLGGFLVILPARYLSAMARVGAEICSQGNRACHGRWAECRRRSPASCSAPSLPTFDVGSGQVAAGLLMAAVRSSWCVP